MNNLLAVIIRELNQIKQSKLLIIIMVLTPLIFCLICCETFSRGYAFNLPIAVLDNDNSALSRQMVRMVQATPSVDVAYRVLSLDEGKDLIKRNKAYAVLYVPKDFEKDIFSLKQPQAVLYYNNQYMLVGSMVSKDVMAAVNTFSTGVGINFKMKKENINQKQALTQAMPVNLTDYIKSNPYLNYSYFLSTSASLQIFHIIVCFVAIWAFGIEYKRGSAKEWLEKANNSMFLAIFGKLLPYFIIEFILALVCFLIMFLGYGVPLKGNIIFLLLATGIWILVYQMMGIFFVELLRNMRFAMSCCAFYTSLGFTFAGVTFPVLAMPLAAKIYSFVIPLQPYLKIFYDQTIREIPWSYDLKSLFVMSVMLLPGICFAYRLRQGADNEKYWGRE